MLEGSAKIVLPADLIFQHSGSESFLSAFCSLNEMVENRWFYRNSQPQKNAGALSISPE